ncbi:hypothetical protein HDU97_000975, partial [Phlyctochytrium planicorne]
MTSNPTSLISPSDILIDTSAFLGKGACGVVYKCKYANETAVVKRLNLQRESKENERAFRKEAETLARINHPRIVTFYGLAVDEGRYSIVLEYMPLGSLYNHYTASNKTKTSLSVPSRLSLAMDVAVGMEYLHANHILHRDLKSLNVLLSRDEAGFHAKITDFGLALVNAVTSTQVLNTRNEALSGENGGGEGAIAVEETRTTQGTLLWMAVELHSLRVMFKKPCDVFSFGVVMTELASFTGPYGISILDDRYDALLDLLIRKRQIPDLSFLSTAQPPPFPVRKVPEGTPDYNMPKVVPFSKHARPLPPPVVDLVVRCLDVKPAARPTFKDIVECLRGLDGAAGVVTEAEKAAEKERRRKQRDELKGNKLETVESGVGAGLVVEKSMPLNVMAAVASPGTALQPSPTNPSGNSVTGLQSLPYHHDPQQQPASHQITMMMPTPNLVPVPSSSPANDRQFHPPPPPSPTKPIQQPTSIAIRYFSCSKLHPNEDPSLVAARRRNLMIAVIAAAVLICGCVAAGVAVGMAFKDRGGSNRNNGDGKTRPVVTTSEFPTEFPFPTRPPDVPLPTTTTVPGGRLPGVFMVRHVASGRCLVDRGILAGR